MRRRGFTLLELLFATGLLATLLVAAHELLSQSRRVARAAERGLDHDKALIGVLRRLREALAAAQPYQQIHEDLDFRGDEEDLRWTTSALRGPGGEARPASLHLGQDGDGVFLEVFPLGWLQTESQREQTGEVVRLPTLRRISLDYSDGKDWKASWVYRKLLRLPRAVRLRLTIERPVPGGVRAEPTELVVPLVAERDVGVR